MANPSVFGQSVNFTATVSPSSGSGVPTGSVTFSDGTTTLGRSSLSGAQATFTAPSLSVGSHSITASYGGDSNFQGSTSAIFSLMVNPAPLTIAANNASRMYGSANPVFTPTSSSLVNGDSLASIGISVTCSTTATASSPVGSYPITCSGPSSTANYTITYQSGSLSITPAPRTITANSTTKVLDGPNLAFTVAYSGFVNGDSQASLGGTLSCTTTATTTSPVGSYPINCSGQSSNNYSITYVQGALKILYASGGTCYGDACHQILQPIYANGSSVFKLGQTIPAKFRVCDANGVSISTAGVVSSFFLTQIISGTTTNNVESIVDTNNLDTAFRWDPTNQQWIFNISTSNLSVGQTYVYSITLNDGTMIGFQFGLKQ